MRRRLYVILLIVIISLTLVSCGADTSKVKIKNVESELFTADEITNAIDTALSYFENSFGGCTMKDIHYIGDEFMKSEYRFENEDYNAQRIILACEFINNTNENIYGHEQGETISDWTWTLQRDNDEKGWTVLSFGYN